MAAAPPPQSSSRPGPSAAAICLGGAASATVGVATTLLFSDRDHTAEAQLWLLLTVANVALLGIPQLRGGSATLARAALGAVLVVWCVVLSVLLGRAVRSDPPPFHFVNASIPDPELGECVRVSAGATPCNTDADVFAHERSLAFLNLSREAVLDSYFPDGAARDQMAAIAHPLLGIDANPAAAARCHASVDALLCNMIALTPCASDCTPRLGCETTCDLLDEGCSRFRGFFETNAGMASSEEVMAGMFNPEFAKYEVELYNGMVGTCSRSRWIERAPDPDSCIPLFVNHSAPPADSGGNCTVEAWDDVERRREEQRAAFTRAQAEWSARLLSDERVRVDARELTARLGGIALAVVGVVWSVAAPPAVLGRFTKRTPFFQAHSRNTAMTLGMLGSAGLSILAISTSFLERERLALLGLILGIVANVLALRPVAQRLFDWDEAASVQYNDDVQKIRKLSNAKVRELIARSLNASLSNMCCSCRSRKPAVGVASRDDGAVVGSRSAAVHPTPTEQPHDANVDGSSSEADETLEQQLLKRYGALRILRMRYQALFGFGGKYFLERMLFTEAQEVGVQLFFGLDTGAQTLTTFWGFALFCMLVALNTAVSPTLLARGLLDAVVIFDVCVDLGLLVLNASTLIGYEGVITIWTILPLLVPLITILQLLAELCDNYLVANQREWKRANASAPADAEGNDAGTTEERRRSSLFRIPLPTTGTLKVSRRLIRFWVPLLSVCAASSLLGTTYPRALSVEDHWRAELGDCVWDRIKSKVLFERGFWSAAEWDPASVVELDASKCGLTTLPPAFELFTSMERLDLRGNRFTTVPRALPMLIERGRLVEVRMDFEHVRTVDWSGAELSELHASALLCGAAELTELILADNALSGLGIEEAELSACFPKLRTLNLTGNGVESLPSSWFTELGELRTLDVSANRIKTLDASSAVWLYSSNETRQFRFWGNPIESVAWSGVAHRRWHPDLLTLSGLTSLSVVRCGIEDSLDALSGLTQLRVLLLEHNRLWGGLGVLAKMTGLMHVDLGQNALEGTIPPLDLLTLLRVL